MEVGMPDSKMRTGTQRDGNMKNNDGNTAATTSPESRSMACLACLHCLGSGCCLTKSKYDEPCSHATAGLRTYAHNNDKLKRNLQSRNVLADCLGELDWLTSSIRIEYEYL